MSFEKRGAYLAEVLPAVYPSVGTALAERYGVCRVTSNQSIAELYRIRDRGGITSAEFEELSGELARNINDDELSEMLETQGE